LHYYRCLKCTGVNQNAHTTPNEKKKSAEALFVELLQRYEIPKKIFPLIEFQLRKLYDYYSENNNVDNELLEKQFDSLRRQLKDLKIRFGLGKIDDETYELTSEHLNEQISKISKELNSSDMKISNLDKLLESSLKKLANISRIWVSSEFEEKKILQKHYFLMEFIMMQKTTNI